jgi:hypothetical protein
LPLCGCRRHPQCEPRSTFGLEMCQPMAPVLPVSERKLRHVAVWWAAPRQATACQYLVTVVPGAKHKGTWKLIPMSAFQGESGHHNSAASYRLVCELLRQVPRPFGLGAKNTFCDWRTFRHHDLTASCLLMAQSGHPSCAQQCPLLGVKRTWQPQTL